MIVYWLMGSLGGVDLTQIRWAMIPIVGGLVALSLFGRALDALSMGDDEARALGVPAQPVRYGVIGTATLVSALSVSLAGLIGWVGLVFRMWCGSRLGREMPVCCRPAHPVERFS